MSKFCLLSFLLLSGCLISVGRANFGLWQALYSRYSESSALVPVIMLAMLIASPTAKNIFTKVVSVFLLVLMLVNIPFGWSSSIRYGKSWYDHQRVNAEILINFDIVPDSFLTRLHPDASLVRNMAVITRDLGYNVFRK